MFKVGIIGATGYVGVELLRLLLNHDKVTVTAISSSTFKDEEISSVYKSFFNKTTLVCEDKSDVINTVEFVNMHDVQGIKLQLLHVLKETDLETEYVLGKFEVLSLEEYTDILCDAIEHIRDDIILHRITGDGAKKDLIAPLWSADKKKTLNFLNKYLQN